MFEGLLLVLPLLMPARAPPKCGCCGEAGHNRRNCPHLARIREQQGMALAVARSMQPGSEPQDEPDEPVEGEAAESDGSGEEEQGEPARYRGSGF